MRYALCRDEYIDTLNIIQNGNTVTGTGTVESFSGMVSGNILTGIMDNKDSDYGIRLTMSPDGEKFNMERQSSNSSWLSTYLVSMRV